MTLVDEGNGTPGAENDVVDVLLTQHDRVRKLIAQVTEQHGAERREAFDELRTLLAVHEAAEEEIVHNATRRVGDDAIADAREQEEHEAGRSIGRLEGLELDSAEFDRAFATFAQAVSDHAEHEEREEFPALRHGASAQDLRKMAEHVTQAQESAMASLNEQEPFAARLEEAGAAMKPNR